MTQGRRRKGTLEERFRRPLHMTDLRRSVDAYLTRKGLDGLCQIVVSQNGQWVELSGKVDSQGTRAALFSLIPPKKGSRYVVDKLRVVAC